MNERSRPVGIGAAPTKLSGTDVAQHTVAADWKRRQEAARRMEPLDCGCRDQWQCRCTEPPLTEQRIDAGRDAALHVLANTDCIPLLEIEVLQALWRRGGTDKQLAELLHQLTDGQVA